MARYDRGYDRSIRPATGDWAAPSGSRRGMRNDRYESGERPWVGGYREGYQGGSSGIPVGGGYMPDTQPRGGRQSAGRRYGRDYWWLGERAFDQQRGRSAYDDAYRRFDEAHHPRYSPVGGNYHAAGPRRPPRPLREEQWFSDWTRWF